MSREKLPTIKSFGGRLRFLRDKIIKLSRKKFVKGLGISEDTLVNYEKNTHPPKFNFPQKIWDVYHGRLTIEEFNWLTAEEDNKQYSSDEFAHIPLYDVHGSEGPGTIVAEDDEKPVAALDFRKEWIHKELHLSIEGLQLITTTGDSMAPTLNPGDILLVEKYRGQPVTDGIYVIKLDGALLVKRIQHLPGRQLKVTSDNPYCSDFNVTLDMATTDFEIYGRVVWAGKRF